MPTLYDGTEIGCGTTRLVAVKCWCGMWHAIPAELYRMARDNQQGVYCPIGHRWVFTQSEADRLRKELQTTENRLASERAQHDQTKASLRAKKAEITKLKSRVHNGVCPHCNRYFSNLHAHMTSKHKDEKCLT